VNFAGVGVGLRGNFAHVAVDIRLVDSSTGQILKSVNGVGKASETGIALAANLRSGVQGPNEPRSGVDRGLYNAPLAGPTVSTGQTAPQIPLYGPPPGLCPGRDVAGNPVTVPCPPGGRPPSGSDPRGGSVRIPWDTLKPPPGPSGGDRSGGGSKAGVAMAPAKPSAPPPAAAQKPPASQATAQAPPTVTSFATRGAAARRMAVAWELLECVQRLGRATGAVTPTRTAPSTARGLVLVASMHPAART
jgi:hypothetical protein